MRMMVTIVAMVLAGALSAVAFAAAEPNNMTSAPTLDRNGPDRAAAAPGNQAGARQAGPRQAGSPRAESPQSWPPQAGSREAGPHQAEPRQSQPRATVAGRAIRGPNAPGRSSPATPRGRTGSATQARGPQHTMQDNTAALRTALRAPVHRGQTRQSTVRQGVTRPDPVSNSHAPNSANAPQLSAGRTGVIPTNSRVTGNQAIASNGMPGNRRPPTGLVTIGGAVTNRNATRAVIDGNAVHRRF
jgi:hypothetical protein